MNDNETPTYHEVARDMIECEIDQSIALAIIREEIEVNANIGNAMLSQYLEDIYRQIERSIEAKILN